MPPLRRRLDEADHHLHSRYDRIELPRVRPVVTRLERYAGQCSCCGCQRALNTPHNGASKFPRIPDAAALAETVSGQR